MTQRLFELYCTLKEHARPSAHEETCTVVLQKLATPFADEVWVDTIGNVIARKKGNGKKLMLTAHMDTLGFAVKLIDERGFLEVELIGAHHAAYLLGTPVQFPNGTKGAICARDMDAYLDSEKGKIGGDDLRIDIGALSREEAERIIQPGDACVFSEPIKRLQGNVIAGPYSDDLMGCAILLKCMEDVAQPENDVYYVFSTQEEIGLHGSKRASAEIRPEVGIAVDVFPTDDDLAKSLPHCDTGLGRGAALMLMDGESICDRRVTAKLEVLAEAKGIPLQKYAMAGGGSDAASMQRSGAYVAEIDIPQRHWHGPAETIDLNDAACAVKLIEEAVMYNWKEDF